jgi:Ca2+-transporting ATPase
MVQTIHSAVKGRARYKVKGLYRSEPLKNHLESKLSERDEINHFSVSILTGNLLIVFNSGNSHSDITSLISNIVLEHEKNQEEKSPLHSPSGNPPSLLPPLYKGGGEEGSYSNRGFSRRKLRKLIIRAEDQSAEQWHLKGAGDVLSLLQTSKASGLSGEQAEKNLKKYGPNILPESVPRSGFSIFIDQFKSLPVALLGAAAVISIFTGGIADAFIIMGVVTINASIGYATESQAEKTIHSLKSLVRPSALVIRDGSLKVIKAEDVAIGDILSLKPGSYVSADARLIEANHLSIDESALTGESMPVLKTVETPDRGIRGQVLELRVQSNNEIPLADRTNMVYMGTLVTGGQGFAVVIATGRFTEIGKIQTLVGEAEPPDTPMERQLNLMGSQLVIIGGAVCGIVFVIGLLRGYGFLEMLKTSISLAVAAVPEGLPTVATTTLALGIRDMKRHNVLIRHLEAVETLGSVQSICLDKTGTITMNRMSVAAIYAGMMRIKVSDGRFLIQNEDVIARSDNDEAISKGEIASPSARNDRQRGYLNPFAHDEFLRLIHVSVICSESEVSRQNDEYIVSGSATENALIYMAISAGVDIMEIRERHPLIKINHRSENRNFMSTLHSLNPHDKFVALKGSPTEVLSLCRWYIKDGERIPLTDESRLEIEIENERMAGDALRVLGVAYAIIEQGQEEQPSEHPTPNSGLIWLGLVGMADPIRNGVKGLIGNFHNAGIDTVMITGDQSPTAYAIGKELNLSRNGQIEILDSTHLTDIDTDVMKALCEKVHVFARVSPAHKLKIVQSLQNAGKVVAMTGDGINDGPALKAADIGIAMGHTGTDVAREVADVVLEDDNLETMVIAISQGRTIYNNIRKSVHFLLATNLSEIMVMFTAIAGGIGQPLSAMQLLWINLMSDIAPGLALALEPPEPDVLSHPPRNPDEPIVRRSDFKRIAFESATLSACAMGAYGYGMARYGIGPKAGTMAFMSLTTGQILHAISCRSEKHSIFDKEKMPPNKYLNMALTGSICLQMIVVAVPGLRGLLGITPINILDGIVIGGSAVLPLLINEGTKK